jgi:hypothetical protein
MSRDPLSLDWPSTEPRNERESHAQFVGSAEANTRNRQRLPRDRGRLKGTFNPWPLAGLLLIVASAAAVIWLCVKAPGWYMELALGWLG